MTKRPLGTLAIAALALGLFLLVAFAVVLGINLSNDAHRKRVVRNVIASLKPGMTADQAEGVFILHDLPHSRDARHIGGIVRTPKGSMKLVYTDTQVNVMLSPQGFVSGIETKDVYTSF
jgi:hypothetical protein